MRAQFAEQRTGGVRESTVSIRVVQGLVDAVVATGVDRNQFLAAAGFGSGRLDDEDARVARSDMFRLCELALDMTGDVAFGLHWGELYTDSTFTPLSHLIAHSDNLGVGFQTLFDYQRLMTDETTYELLQDGDRVTLRLSALTESSSRLRKFVIEMEAVGIYRLMRTFGADVRPEQVAFAYPAPAYRD